MAGLVIGERIFDLAPHLGPGVSVRALLDDWDRNLDRLQDLAEGLADQEGDHRLGTLPTRPPLLPPGQLFLSGANYRQHVIELVLAERRSASTQSEDELRAQIAAEIEQRVVSGRPYVFLGLPSSICGPYDDVVLPNDGEQHDWELELAVVIGRRARHVPREEALGYVAGYTICNDITTRDRVFRADLPSIGTDWLHAKNAPTFYPTGPLLVPAPFVPDPMGLRITLRLNGQLMQDATTGDMIFGIDRLIEHVSAITQLQPGDLLLTGSPAGNGVRWRRFLRPGDVMEGEITGLGVQRNRCVAESRLSADGPRAGRRDEPRPARAGP
ncbi:MAG TPA: fumarylacetoacetate hydrolase family protein [Candidatus Dormibacteraeota bacterium]|nr:fumarylacetoacetate hydrolase family protein [Candidatus Dormibacteraeota bacterium]